MPATGAATICISRGPTPRPSPGTRPASSTPDAAPARTTGAATTVTTMARAAGRAPVEATAAATAQGARAPARLRRSASSPRSSPRTPEKRVDRAGPLERIAGDRAPLPPRLARSIGDPSGRLGVDPAGIEATVAEVKTVAVLGTGIMGG